MGVPRLFGWLFLTIIFLLLALWLQAMWPGSVMAVTAYKAHLMALGGWGGYWLDRALFPYDRPHTYLLDDQPEIEDNGACSQATQVSGVILTAGTFSQSMLRRAIIVAACLICVGLGA